MRRKRTAAAAWPSAARYSAPGPERTFDLLDSSVHFALVTIVQSVALRPKMVVHRRTSLDIMEGAAVPTGSF